MGDEQKFWSIEEVEKLTPDQRAALFYERTVTDLSTLDPEYLERIRVYGRKILEERGIVLPATPE